MQADVNKDLKVSLRLSRKFQHPLWQEIRKIKCPPHSSPQGNVNSNPNPNLKDKPNTDANPILGLSYNEVVYS